MYKKQPLNKTYPYPVSIITKSGLRGMYIRLTRDKTVKVTAPQSMPVEEIIRFIDSKDAWIRRNLSRMADPVHYEYFTGEMHYFLGNRYPLHFFQASSSGIALRNGRLEMDMTGRTKNRALLYRKLMKEELKKVLISYIRLWAPRMKVTPASVTVKVMKSRWGSCNVKTGDLCFALDLVTKPEDCIESVVVHELNHLLETGHTPRFHALMVHWLPDYKERTKILTAWPREFI
ncbi:M48 family metallopeptidase [uncultured Dialister sp.]|uniref:M48 family metallopeptidase n=1 Tax=uncultured Dialister sp. TaxID=278064 RepID=UPI0025E16451|nr:SprT family zinc-dependent metalloprotease [uncultured Dialister sp.]